MKFTRKTWLAIAAGALLASPVAIASDHTDGSQATTDPAADITDLYAWMTDSTTMTLIMDVTKAASATTLFSDTVKYTFHTYAHGPAGGAAGAPLYPILGGTTDPEVDVTCTFAGTAAPQTISCWVTSGGHTLDYVTGPASMTTPLSSTDGLIDGVYAGLASDPFFFNLAGFKTAAATVTAAKGTLTYDAAGCPAVAGPTLTLLDTQLTSGVDGGAPVDDFSGLNVLAIVVQIDTGLLIPQADAGATDTLVSVWASTNS